MQLQGFLAVHYKMLIPYVYKIRNLEFISQAEIVVTCFLWIIAVLENQVFWTVLPLNYVLLTVIVQRIADISGLPQGWGIVKKDLEVWMNFSIDSQIFCQSGSSCLSMDMHKPFVSGWTWIFFFS